MAVHRRDDADVRLVQLGDGRLAVALARVVLAGDLAVHVDADQDRAAGLPGNGQRVLERALPGDQAGLLPVLGGGREPSYNFV